MAHVADAFLNPSDEFTPIPFWFWNDRLTNEEIIRQIQDFHDKGVTGFVLHPRLGIPEDIEYLSDDFMGFVQTAVDEADRLNMTVILYDEGMYPSGSANGLVVKSNPEYASRGLKMVEFPCSGTTTMSIPLEDGDTLVSVQAVKKLDEKSICKHESQMLDVQNDAVSFTPPDVENWSIVCFIETYSKGTIRGIHYGEDDGEKNAPRSTDLLNPEAVNTFIKITHERYYEVLGKYFGNTVRAFFTDEPDILGRARLKGLQRWSRDFYSYYLEVGNKEVDLPALWFDIGEDTEKARVQYKKAIHQRMIEVYYKPLSEWCAAHKIALTGHPERSDDIGLLDYFQIPGQDVVWRWVAPEDERGISGGHSTAGKCSADAARHRGRRRNLNEVLGVCGIDNGWHLPGGDMKWYFDWLFVRGVNLISPHAFYYSIREQSRSHERPPDVGRNNIWWPHYDQFSTYIKRLSWLMTDSVNQTEIAVLCEEDFLPWRIVKPLFEQQIEFNYLEESLLKKSSIQESKLVIEQQEYRLILIEEVSRLSEKTIQLLQKFMDEGGIVLTLEQHKQLTGARQTRVENLVQSVEEVGERKVKLIPSGADLRFSLVRKAGQSFYLFVNEGEATFTGNVEINEIGKLQKWDAWNGTIDDHPQQLMNGKLIVPLELKRRDSIIFHINSEEEPIEIVDKQYGDKQVQALDGEWVITLDGQKLPTNALGSWTKLADYKYVSGTAQYELTFKTKKADHIQLDLGEAHELVQLWVNEQKVGTKMWAPYDFDITDFVEDGENKLTIKVTNSKANEMDQLSLPSGLIGPVQIVKA